MNELPIFSIATPTRNALACLPRCVGSVRGQTGVRLEHLIQDALSTDGTPAWLAAHASQGSVVEADKGMYDAINRAWSRSRGQYLSWLNADEQYLPGTLQHVHDCFEAFPHVDVIFGNYIVTLPNGEVVAVRKEVPFRRFYVKNGFLYAQSCTLFFRRRLWDEGLLQFDTSLRYAADHDLMLKLSKAGARVMHLDRFLGLFGIDGSNLSGHARMREETALVQSRHGALRTSVGRSLAFAGRRFERLLRGAYRRKSVSFAFALDEQPTYKTVSAQNVGGRYGLQAQALR